MKKFIYIALLAFVVCLSFSSCTEEVVKPKTDNSPIGVGMKE